MVVQKFTLEAALPIDPKYAPYARETAMCVDFAYEAMEGDLCAELEKAEGATRLALGRLLLKLQGRREALSQFTILTNAA